jgi:hypothetical protein
VPKASKVYKVLRGLMELKVRKAYLVYRELRALMVFKVRLVLRAL